MFNSTVAVLMHILLKYVFSWTLASSVTVLYKWIHSLRNKYFKEDVKRFRRWSEFTGASRIHTFLENMHVSVYVEKQLKQYLHPPRVTSLGTQNGR